MSEPLGAQEARRLSATGMRRADVAVVLWCLLWLGMGLWIALEVRSLADLSDTVARVGVGLQRTGDALGSVASVPLVGGDIGDLARSISDAGTSAVGSGTDSVGDIHRLSILLGIAVALMPTVPVLALYLPARIARRREVAAVLRARREARGSAAFEEFLARRAVDRLPYHVLSAEGADPWHELREGRFGRLAALELERLGIRSREG